MAMKVAVVAFGTRGDVQPLVILAAGLAARSTWCKEVVFLTHQLHAVWVESLLKLSAGTEHCGDDLAMPQLATVDSPPVMWKGRSGSDAAEARANLTQQYGCTEACRGAGLVVFNMFALEGFHVSEAYNIPCVVCHPYLTTATPMPSSFPARMRRTHPRLFRRLTRIPDKQNPSSSLKAAQGGGATVAERSGREDAAGIHRARVETAWAHVEHWMWPLFTDRWAGFRERLGLHPCPFQEEQTVGALGRRTGYEGLRSPAPGDGGRSALTAVDPAQLPLVLYLFSPSVVDASPFWPDCVRVCGYLYPTPTPATKTAQPTSNLEPACGLGDSQGRRATPPSADPPHQADSSLAQASEQPENDVGYDNNDVYYQVGACPDGRGGGGGGTGLPSAVEAFLSAREDRPIYVGFGSMWTMCSPGYRLALALRVVLLGARQAGSRCVVHLPSREAASSVGAGGCEGADTGEGYRLAELDSAMDWVLGEFAASAAQDDLLMFQGPLAHDLLLPRCSVAIHHGGSGTTAAVLGAGIPQVVCPQQLDQFFWSERVGHLAVGRVLERSLFVEREPAPIGPPAGPLVRQAAAAILSALTPQTKLRAACLGVKIRAENGLENALDSLSLFARESELLPTVSTAAQVEAEPPHQPNSMVADTGTAQPRGEHQLVLRDMPNGLRVWWSSRAEEEAFFVFGEVFEDRTYARMGIRVQDGDTVWDVGANVGLASIFFELEADTPDSVQVYAFEPLPLNAAALKRNLAKHCPTAVIQEYALGALYEDRVPATFYPRMPGNSTLRPLEKERLQGGAEAMAGEGARGNFFEHAEQVTCDVRTLSWAMAKLGVDRIDLLKIDVEGAELDVLLGVDEQDWPKVGQVVAEVHPVGDRLPRACKLLRDHGFDVSTQALGLDGTPISPTRDGNAALDAQATGTATGDGGLKAPRREEQSELHQSGEDTFTAAQDRQPRFDRGPESLSSTIGDGREAGDGRSCHSNNVALDGVVFIVYATRS